MFLFVVGFSKHKALIKVGLSSSEKIVLFASKKAL